MTSLYQLHLLKDMVTHCTALFRNLVISKEFKKQIEVHTPLLVRYLFNFLEFDWLIIYASQSNYRRISRVGIRLFTDY